MKWRNLLLLLLFQCTTICAQMDVILRRAIKVDCPNQIYYIERCPYALMIPVSRPGRQEVLSYTYPEIQPAFVNTNGKKETFLNWKEVSFGALKKSAMRVEMKIRLHIYDLKTARKKPKLNKKDMDTIPYLKDEENFRCESKSMQTTAAGIKGIGREEIVKNIFDFVLKTLDYKIFFLQDRGAKQALKDGQGDCTEYSELMVTLCRAKKIPARIVMGLTMHTNGSVGYHNWTEVFFPEYGWVSFDPTWADGPSGRTTFDKMKNCYVELSHERFTHEIQVPCSGTYPFNLSLSDSCDILSNDAGKKNLQMQNYYNAMQLGKADSLLDTLISMEPDQYSHWLFKGVIKARQGDFVKARNYLRTCSENVLVQSEKSFYLYALANYYALKNEADSSVQTLKEAETAGHNFYSQLEKDIDFEKIKDHPAFVELKKEWAVKEEERKKGKKQ